MNLGVLTFPEEKNANRAKLEMSKTYAQKVADNIVPDDPLSESVHDKFLVNFLIYCIL